MGNNSEMLSLPLKTFKKIPIYVVEEHNEALQFIYSAIGGKKLHLVDNTLLHLDAHPDMLIDRKLKGKEARSGRKLLPLLQIENWIVPAAAAGHIGRIVWLRPPWAKQFTDGTRTVHVGDHPVTGLLRVDSKEPYYMSDALYSARLNNKKSFSLTVAELGYVDGKTIEKLAGDINIEKPYILDIDLDFFSTGNPFLNLYENINLYDRLEEIFEFNLPRDDDEEMIEKVVLLREKQLDELESLFEYLGKHKNFNNYVGIRSELFSKVSELADVVTKEAERIGEVPDWWAVFAGGCTRDQGGLPYHISTEEEIKEAVTMRLKHLLGHLPPPILITVARSTDDGYCPPEHVELIQSLVLRTLSEVYVTDDPFLHYLKVS